jgi:hypothetical protein
MIFDDSLSDEEIAELEGDEYEAAVRRKWGYTVSETRTEAERHQAAARMLEKFGGSLRNAEVGGNAFVPAPSEFRPDPKPGKP